MALVLPVEDGKIKDTTTTSSKTSSTSSNGNDLGYDQFLQLLCAEMQYQDPLEPTSNTEYVAQLATFSQMEATLSMQSTIESSNANALVGQYVIIKTTSPTTGETTATAGFVDYIQKENGEQKVCVNGNLYSLSDVYQVADPEYMEAVSLAEAFKTQVSKLPSAEQLTLSDEKSISDLTKVYESMSTYQKSYIDSSTLTKYKELVAQMAVLKGTTTGTGSTTDSTTGSTTGGTTDSTTGSTTGSTT